MVLRTPRPGQTCREDLTTEMAPVREHPGHSNFDNDTGVANPSVDCRRRKQGERFHASAPRRLSDGIQKSFRYGYYRGEGLVLLLDILRPASVWPTVAFQLALGDQFGSVVISVLNG